MASVTLEQVNANVLSLKSELDEIRELLEESSLDLGDSVKEQVRESRSRPISKFKSQEDMEKKFS